MRKDITIAAESRDSRGKNEARRLRVKGRDAGHSLRRSRAPRSRSPSTRKNSARILNSKTGHNTIFNLELAGGEKTPVMIVDWQYDPIKDNLLHVDLKRIDLTKRIHVKVPLSRTATPKA